MTKSNVGPKGSSLVFRILPGTSCGEVVWDGPTWHTAEDLLGVSAAPDRPLQVARELLQSQLRDGAKTTEELKAAAAQAAVGWRTMERARASIPIKITHTPVPGRRGPGPGSWQLQGRDEVETSATPRPAKAPGPHAWSGRLAGVVAWTMKKPKSIRKHIYEEI